MKRTALVQRKYLHYKDSGVEWLGEIPKHWVSSRLKFAVSMPEVKLPEKPTECIYLGLENIEPWTGRLLLDNPIESVDSSVNTFHAGDVLFGKLRPYLAKVAQPNFDGVSTTEILSLTAQSNINNKFLFYVMLSEGFIKVLDSATYGTKMPRANTEQIGNMVIPIPSPPEQRAITDFLDRETARIDTMIAKYQRLLELLEEKRTSIISQAVTKGLDETLIMKNTGLNWIGQIPNRWKVMKFKHIANISYGLTLELDRTITEGTKIISLPNVTKDGRLLLDDVPYTDLSEQQKKELLLKRGDLLFNWRNGSPEHVGKTVLFDSEDEYTHVSFLLRIRFVQTLSNPSYFLYYLSNLRNIGFFSSSKTRVNKTYNQTELKELEIIVPSLKEQNQITEYLNQRVNNLNSVISKIITIVNRLQEYRTALISSTVTGQIQVNQSEG
jgi:type I restriction enzyme, S subunit